MKRASRYPERYRESRLLRGDTAKGIEIAVCYGCFDGWIDSKIETE